jgi:hypothetical protein
MKKIFSLTIRQVYVVLSLVLLVLLAAWYYLAYIPDKEKDLYEGHFRWLQKMDENIRNKIDASDSLLSNLQGGYLNSSTDVNCYKKIISGYSCDSLTFSFDTIGAVKAVNKFIGLDTANLAPQYFLNASNDTNQLVISVAFRKPGSNVLLISMSYNFIKFFRSLLQPGIFEHYVIFYNGRYIYEDFHSGICQRRFVAENR